MRSPVEETMNNKIITPISMRVKRSVSVSVEHIHNHTFKAFSQSNGGAYVVSLLPVPRCNCADFQKMWALAIRATQVGVVDAGAFELPDGTPYRWALDNAGKTPIKSTAGLPVDDDSRVKCKHILAAEACNVD